MSTKKRETLKRSLMAQVMRQEITMSEATWKLMVADGIAADEQDAQIKSGVKRGSA